MKKSIGKDTILSRESNFELMRIVCMLLILMSHYAIHGGFSFDNTITANRLLMQFLSTFGEIGVAGFALITGYFQIENDFKKEKVKRIWIQVLFYSLLCFFIYVVAVDSDAFTIKNTLKACFPLLTVEYWFATTYLTLYILSPYINAMIKNISKEKMLELIGFLVLIWYFMMPFFDVGNIGSTSLGLFILCYLVGAYFRMYTLEKRKEIIIGAVGGCMYIGLLCYMLLMDILSVKNKFFEHYINSFIHLNSFLVLGTAIFIFILFKNMRVESTYINKYAGYMFGLYLFHDHEYMRGFLWRILFKNSDYQESKCLVLHMFASCLVVLMISFVIEFIRIALNKFVNRRLCRITF